ncbi:ATP-binding cassette domain-containing protein [Alkalicoccobacillus porphyridii]|nr:ABC transporter ATP-binding protein [Alkalicoccobacillus porphyridii]
MQKIEIKNLSKSYGSKKVIEDLTLTLEGNRIYGLIGENGTGKSTLLRLISGLARPTKGTIEVNGKKNAEERRSQIAYLSDQEAFDGFSTIAYQVDFHQKMVTGFQVDRVYDMLNTIRLSVDQKIKNLSKGHRNLFNLILTLANPAPILVLDEPLSGIDTNKKEDLVQLLSTFTLDEERLIIFATHEYDEIEFLIDGLIIIKDSRLVYFTEDLEKMRLEHGKTIQQIFKEVNQ